jgi:CopA family copper-resistance protein
LDYFSFVSDKYKYAIAISVNYQPSLSKNNKMKYIINCLLFLLVTTQLSAQTEPSKEGNPDNLPIHEYTLTIAKDMVNMAGKTTPGMTVNGGIPGPTLRFTEGEYAVIYVKNEMDIETSVHWHGLLLPNFYDGVPYLNTPPIAPGETLKYEFALNQSGTYWYHSHTMLQEQSGVYGSIVIEKREETLDYDRDLVMILSDWTNEKPMNVLRNLKRGNEWYGIKKGTATPLNQVIGRGALGAQFNFWKQRMEGADIADVYYNGFFINGKAIQEYSEFKPGEKIRLRFINAGASTYFWLTFGGEDPLLVSADGKDIVPVSRNKTIIGNAETYDFIITIPSNGKLEVRATAQDGSGQTSAYLGQGAVLTAPDVMRPDKIGMMQKMAKMDMKMGAPAIKFNSAKDERFDIKAKYGMQMEMSDMPNMKAGDKMSMPKDTMSKMHKMHNMKKDKMASDEMNMPQDTMPKMHDMKGMGKHEMSDMKSKDKMSEMNMSDDSEMEMSGMNMYAEYNYDFLKSPEPTTYSADAPRKEILLNLTGNMNRYIWSFNGVPLSETDMIKIKSGEVTRIKLNNLTMMHHPIHLHGHFFRVINENGEHSPLKHTVNVPPMQEVTIEFYGNEYGDWFLHCHVLYHMMGGMARVFSYDTPRDERMKDYPADMIIDETDHTFGWGTADIASQMSGVSFVASDLRNQLDVVAEYGYNKNLEAEVTYQRYLYDYAGVFIGANVENGTPGSLDDLEITAVAGMRFLTPYLFDLDVRVDNKLRPRIGIGRSVMIFPRFSVFGYYEYQADFGAVENAENQNEYSQEIVWSAGAEYLLSRNLSLMASYDNRFGAGGGLSVRF